MKKDKRVSEHKKRAHRHRVWLWLFIVILIIAGAVVWVLHDGGVINLHRTVITEQIIETSDEPQSVKNTDAEEELKPACKVVEELLLSYIVPDTDYSFYNQYDASKTYTVLAKYGCPENATFFTDMAARKQAIAEGLEAVQRSNNNEMTSTEYLYSDEKICQTIETRVIQNINPNAYTYSEFLQNANTYSVLYEYGCKENKVAYMRAAVRELGVAVALMPTDKMQRDEIVTVVEICKSLGVAEAAHLMLQRLKARGYDMEFLLEMENIIHGIR